MDKEFLIHCKEKQHKMEMKVLFKNIVRLYGVFQDFFSNEKEGITKDSFFCYKDTSLGVISLCVFENRRTYSLFGKIFIR